jgi:RecB family exonuclease
LLPPRLVDQIRPRHGPVGGHPSHAEIQRLDPTFREHPDVALTPADARVHAVARVCLDRKDRDILALARDARHRTALEGVVWGLRIAHERLRVPYFTEYDGLLSDPRIVAKIAADFGPERAFSPSQVESFALCPFQFYQRYVLRLDPVDDRPELRIDHASRGDRLHKILEEIHAAIAAEGAEEAALRERVADFLGSRLESEDEDEEGKADVASALRALEEIELRRTLGKYAREFRAYHEREGSAARPLHFEWAFGLDPERPDDTPAAGSLDLGTGEDMVRLRGKIDRIDLVESGFRVIDYKTGHAPSSAEVTAHLRAVQLPLYALAVEKLLLGPEGFEARDFGYWTLGREGFRPVPLKGETWAEFRGRVEAEVVRLVRLLRGGMFPVEPKRADCRRFCDYRSACRLTQVQYAEKEPPTIRPATTRDDGR